MPGQYWGAKQGAHAEQDYYLAEYRQFLGADARRRMPLATYNSNNVYPKGALVLEMLKTQLGPEPFWAAMRRYLTAPRLRRGDERRSPAGGARRHRPEPELVLVAVDLLGRLSGLRGDVGLRLDRARAHAHRAPDPDGHRHRRQHRRALRDAARVPRADRHPGRHGRGRRGAPGDHRPPRADGPHRQPARSRPPWWRSTTPTRWSRRSRSTSRRPGSRRCSSGIRISGSGPGPSSSSRARAGDSLAGAALARAARGADYSADPRRCRERAGPVSRGRRPAGARGGRARHRRAGARGRGRRARRRSGARAPSPSRRRVAAGLELPGAGRGACRRSSKLGAPGAREAVLQGLATPSYRDVIQSAAVAAVVQHPDSELVAGARPAARRAAAARAGARRAHGARQHRGAARADRCARRRARLGARVAAGRRGGPARRAAAAPCCARRSRPSGHPRRARM